MVHVVSMLEVMMSFGESVFQSSEVRGAVCSGVFEFESSARGVSFCGGGSLVFTDDERVIVLVGWVPVLWGKDQSRRWSPDVASRSVDCFWVEGGSHNILVTG